MKKSPYPTKKGRCETQPTSSFLFAKTSGGGKVEPTLSSVEKIADALEVGVSVFFSEERPVDVSSYDKSIIERLRLLDELDEEEKRPIFSIIDMAIAKNRMKAMLSDALKMA